MAKLNDIRALAESHAAEISRSVQAWTGYLDTAATLYRYDFPETLLIHAQRPDATACAEMEIWNNRMGRWVNRGSKGIALIDDSGPRKSLRYVFDISDTHMVRGGKTPYIWQMESWVRPEMSDYLADTYGLETDPEAPLPTVLMSLARAQTEENLNDAMDGLSYEIQGTWLEELGVDEKFNRDDRPAAAQMHSLSMSDIIVLHKAGEDHAYYVDSIGFTEVPEFFLSPQEQEEIIASGDPDISAKDTNVPLNMPVENIPTENTVTNEDVVNEDVVVQAREASTQEASRQDTSVQETTLQEEQSAAELNSDQRTEDQRSQKTMQDTRDSSPDPSASEPAIPVEAALTFYAAECIDFPVMGEYHGGLTFEEAVKACRDLPDGQQNGGKGIGFSLHDGSEFEGDFPLIVSGQVQEKVINSIGYFRDSPAVQNAITEAKSYFSDPVSSLAQGQEKPPSVREGAREGRKESVLAALRENREKVRAAEKDKPEKINVTQRKKGELSL